MIDNTTLTSIGTAYIQRVSQLCRDINTGTALVPFNKQVIYDLIETANSEGLLEEVREWHMKSEMYDNELDQEILDKFSPTESKTIRYLLYAGNGGYATSPRPYWSKYGLYTRSSSKPTSISDKQNHKTSYSLAKQLRAATTGVVDFQYAYKTLLTTVDQRLLDQTGDIFELFFGDDMRENPKNNKLISQSFTESFSGDQFNTLNNVAKKKSGWNQPMFDDIVEGSVTTSTDGGDATGANTPVSTFSTSSDRVNISRQKYIKTVNPALNHLTSTSDPRNVYTSSDIVETVGGMYSHSYLTTMLARSNTSANPIQDMSSIFTTTSHSINSNTQSDTKNKELLKHIVQRQLDDNILVETDNSNVVISSIVVSATETSV
tara:strand:- start:1776 stop:2903 length:1128 start_codon:yes stop_codon:yes gene_type:complete